MIAPLAKFIDWSAIQVRVLMMPPIGVRVLPGDGQKSQIEEAIQLIKGPNSSLQKASRRGLNSIPTPWPIAFLRRDRAPSPRTTSFMAGSTVVRSAGRSGP